MEINLKQKLRDLRQRKNITQEALAVHLGITPQSVGKWERGEGFPDITLLPKIAFYFDVTIDDLLCVDKLRVDESIAEYKRQSDIYRRMGENEKNLEMWEKAYSEFPNDCRVIEGLMWAINADEIYPCPMDRAERIIALGEELLKKSNDTKQRADTIQKLCYTYKHIDKQKALYYADMGGSIYSTRESLRSYVLDGEEAIEARQSYIMELIRAAAMEAPGVVYETDYSYEEIIEAYMFSIDILKRLYSDGNVGFYANDLSYYYRHIAEAYAAMNDRENTLKSLEESCKYAIIESESEEGCYTAPMVNRMKYRKSDTVKNYAGNACDLRLKDIGGNIFDFVRNEDVFKKLVAELEKHAENI